MKHSQDRIAVILKERETQHGKFRDHADMSQEFKTVLRRCQIARGMFCGRPPLKDTQTEALEMIVHKIARIYAGDADFVDHWDDIAGYAQLCANELRNTD